MSKINILLLISFIVGAAYGRANDNRPRVPFSGEVTQNIYKVIDQCIAETEVQGDVLHLVRDGNYELGDKFKKYIHCCYVNAGYAYTNGHVKVKEATEVFPKEYIPQVGKVITDCDKEHDDPIENTYQFFICFQDNSPVRMAL